MYLCLCQGITDGDVETAAAKGCEVVKDVFRAHDAQPRCGKCIPYLRSALESAKEAAPKTLCGSALTADNPQDEIQLAAVGD